MSNYISFLSQYHHYYQDLPNILKVGETLLSAKVKKMSPTLMQRQAMKSINEYFFPEKRNNGLLKLFVSWLNWLYKIDGKYDFLKFFSYWPIRCKRVKNPVFLTNGTNVNKLTFNVYLNTIYSRYIYSTSVRPWRQATDLEWRCPWWERVSVCSI